MNIMKVLVVPILLVLVSVSSSIGNEVSYNENPKDPLECPANDDPRRTVHIPHESDCTLFYKCKAGEKNLMHCPPGLHFNAHLQVCDYPSDAGCVSKVVSTTVKPTTVTTKPTTTTTTTEPTTTTTTTTTTKPTTTTLPTTTTNITQPTSTTSEFTTTTLPTTTTNITQPTSTTSEFTITTLPTTTTNITQPTSTTSEFTITTLPTTTTNITQPTSTTSEFTTTTTEKSTTPKPAVPSSCSQVDPNTKIFIPHECVCSKYYLCFNNNALLQECPEPMHFNYAIQDCDFPEDAGCISVSLLH